MEWKQAKEELLRDPKLRAAYNKIDLPHAVGEMIIEARIIKKLTQSQLAELVGTKQPSIARIENGSSLPSLSFLQKIADALNTRLLPPRFELSSHKSQIVSSRTATVYIVDSFDYEAVTTHRADVAVWSKSVPLKRMNKVSNSKVAYA